MSISIHALRVEGDCTAIVGKLLQNDFYPRPPGGGRLQRKDAVSPYRKISIHALRVEGDVYGVRK